LINDLKSKLPFLKKREVAEDDQEQDSDEQNIGESTDVDTILDKTGRTQIHDELDEDGGSSKSIFDKIKAKLMPSKEQGGAKRKISPLFLIILLALVGVLFLDFEDDNSSPTEEVPKLKPRPRPNKKKKDKEHTQQSPVEAPLKAPVETPAETPVEAPAETPVETPAETPVEAPAEAPVETPIETPAETPIETPVDTTLEIPTETVPDETPVQGDQGISAPEDSINEPIGQSTEENDNAITDKILEDLEKKVETDKKLEVQRTYVAPPDYEYRGRGMVYNCTGKHWACVDGPSYKSCEFNYSSTKFLKKPIECYPFNIYETQKGCELMQNRLVSSSAKTDFCKEN
jgi:hypothetical protein